MKQILAAFIFFTQLPLGKIVQVPAEYFRQVVSYWPLTGYLTGGLMALTIVFLPYLFPIPVAVILVMLTRLSVTGALHEDGLADFCDGFGGGTDRERVLSIMKDSHIGTYGVLGLILYFSLSITTLASIPYPLIGSVLLCGDVWSKFCASHIVNFLPYARKAEESKTKLVYDRMCPRVLLINAALALFPVVFLMRPVYWPALFIPVIVCASLIWYMKKRIQGYTGDCCGALFLCSELSFYLAVLAIHYL